ncbi:kinase-like domain-containing protein [Rhizophagus diaphanus]|nr:kinase-like domain-containing protein [Rhizophagus diaphanus] [Rhizophagus sp. MUCL 43196]
MVFFYITRKAKEEYYADRLNGLLRNKIIGQYDSHDLINSKIIGFGGSASVYVANWKNTLTTFAIKKSISNKEVNLTIRANSHENIIQFRGVTKLEGTIKLADFGCLYLKESDDNTRAHGVTPYMDPKFFENPSYQIIEKSDIYSLGVLFWELTSQKSPYKYKTEDDCILRIHILNGLREEPIHNTNVLFVRLYQKCWEYEPNNRPNIDQVISELNSINSENNNESTPKESEETEDLCLLDSD